MWKCTMYIASQMAGTTINAVMIFQYMNIVLIVMQKYHHMKHLLSEAESTSEFDTSKYVFVEDITSKSSNKMFSPAKDALKNNRESHSMCRIQDLQILYNELYDVLYANNKSYEVLILLCTMTTLTNTVPITYSATTVIKFAILRHGHFESFFKGVSITYMCAFKLLRFLWLTWCWHTTTEKVQDTVVCIQKLRLYPNSLGWSKSDVKNLLFQIKNMNVEFNICSFFTMNLQLFVQVWVLYSHIYIYIYIYIY